MLAHTGASDLDLARILQRAADLMPVLHGRQGGEPWPGALHHGQGMAVATDPLWALCRHWETAHPEAGAHYVALRCWGLAIWQPVYLSVIAAHLDTHVPRLSGLAQPVVDGFPQGFQLPVHAPPQAATLPLRMQLASDELRSLCGAARSALMTMVVLHARAADRLQAECVLGALLLVQRSTPSMGAAEAAALAEDWLARLGIAGGCGLLAYRARDGTLALALDRKVCCHHFRRHDGEKCSTCPKLPLDKRIARLLADPS